MTLVSERPRAGSNARTREGPSRELMTIGALVVFGLVVLSPVLNARFVLVDDHEILSLLPPIGAPSDVRPQLDVRGMAFASDPSVGRFRPLYWTVRFGEIALLGDNARAWHALILTFGLVAAGLLYAAGRSLGASRVAAALLGGWLLVAPGVSSLWVRLGADDTLATVFLSLSLLAATRAARTGASGLWDVLLVIAALAATLTKEAFSLAMIGVAVFRASLYQTRTGTWRLARVPTAAWLERRGQVRLYRVGLGLWTATLAAFALSTWTYAWYFTEDSLQLNRLVETVAASTPSSQTIGIAADAARQYEPILSLVDHVAHQGQGNFEIKVLPLAPDRPYSALEASFARDLAASALAQPPLSTCGDLGAMIVLGDEGATRRALPCLNQGFRRLEFSEAVLLWGGDAVSLRPRLPGIGRISYVVYLVER